MRASWEGIVASLRSGAGDSLRTVSYFSASEHTVLYARTDVHGDYDETGLDAVGDDLVLEALSKPQQESLYELGDLRATVRVFEEGSVVGVPISPSRGYAASVDESCTLPARDIVERVRSAQRDRILRH